jgi:heme/copper-type cytochrome/quinol oxidase subunit 2
MTKLPFRRIPSPALLAGCSVAALWYAAAVHPAARVQAALVRHVSVTASRYKFDPVRIEVDQDDLVRVELKTSDIAHSFTVDSYRIAKRVGPGHRVVFEFSADHPGTFPIYCNLRIDDGCRQMKAELVVRPRK